MRHQPLLTGAELQVAVFVAEGLSNAAIAKARNTEVTTVKAQLYRIMAKLGADNRTQVALWVMAQRHDWRVAQ